MHQSSQSSPSSDLLTTTPHSPRRCQEALQEAVALDQGHLPSLMASTVLHLHRALLDPEVHALEQALVTADAAKEAHQRSAAAWSMLAAVYQAHGAQHHKEAASCRFVAKQGTVGSSQMHG